MTKLRRRLLFYALVIVFLPLAGWVTARARGFSFDFDAGVVRESGAIFLRINPAGSAIYLDGFSYQSPSGILRTQAFVSNLTPGAHRIVVVKDGYHRWEKTFVVEPLEVVDAPTIRLFPRAPTIEPLTIDQLPLADNQPEKPGGPRASTTTQTLFALERRRRQLPENASSTLATLTLRPKAGTDPAFDTILYRDLVLSPDQKKALVRTARELWVVWLEKERANGIHLPGEIERIAAYAGEITDAFWLPDDSHHVIFAVDPVTDKTPAASAQPRNSEVGIFNEVGGKVKIAETDGRGGRNTVDLLEAEDVRFFIDPETNGILFTNKDALFRLTL